ncbi:MULTISPECIES: lipopolysaccharide biosynthesis protein [Arthrobacter]|uniref:lipopolysaccharide biosynthesis protein n=1 Tax=Arthrobacter TaxID=1663 RepID=UPI001404DA3B|nr:MULTISPECIES: lipopolysaccharide biosynthesis protein [Arthrobacter]MBT8160328.1 lipopolysaccharide biosynthesis protein [Arthrobacter sp. GN70]
MSQAEPRTGTLASRLRRGTLWGAVNIGLSRLLQFVTTLVLARLVAPEHFGALAVALVVQTIAVNIAELGATAALGRGDRDPDEIAPTVFTISLLTSGLLTALVIILAPLLAAVLGDPGATPVVQVMALTVLLSGLTSVPTALIWRDFLQKRRILVDVLNALVALGLVVPMALWGWGAMALALSRVGGQLTATIGYWIISPKRYKPGFNRAEAKEILRLGLPLAMANLVVFVTLNLDYMVIGPALGPVNLGLYLLAFNLASTPSNIITAIIRTVAVPTFGRLNASGNLREAAVKVTAGIAYVGFPVSALLTALALPLIVAFYGERWSAAAAAMVSLGLFGAARILSEVFADLCVGAGKTVGLFWVQVVWLLALAPAMFFGVRLGGIAGAGMAHVVVTWFVVIPVYLVLVSKSTGARILSLVRTALPAAAAAVACGVVGWLVASWISIAIFAVAAGAVAGLAVYAACTYRQVRTLLGGLRQTSPDGVAPLDPAMAAEALTAADLTADDLTAADLTGERK